MTLTTKVYRDESMPVGLLGPWQELFVAASDPTPFLSVAWQNAWWETWGRARSPVHFTLWCGDDLVGLLPLQLTSGPWRVLRTAGTGVSDYLAPLTRPGFDAPFAAKFADWLDQENSYDLLDLHQLREGEPLLDAVPGAHRIEQAECCVLDLPETFDEYLATLGKSLRYDVRGIERGAFASGEARIRTASGHAEVDRALDAFFALHSRRWKKRGMPGAFALRRIRSFHERISVTERGLEILRLSVLEMGGEPIGAIYAMRAGMSVFFYQSGFDPAYKALSPGTVLVAHAIKQAIEEGATTFDFLRGVEPYKLRWKPQRTLRNFRLVKSVGSLRANLGLQWNLSAANIEGRVRGRLEGRGLV